MVLDATVSIIKAALAVDTQATPEEKKQIMASLFPRQEAEKMITTKEVCGILGISRRTLWNYVQEGKLKPVQYSPRKIRYRFAEVADFSSGRA
jgi:excisionase family DNA binding protein